MQPNDSTPPAAGTPSSVLRFKLQAAYRELHALEQRMADLRADLEQQRQRVAALERAAVGLGQQ